MFLPFDYTLSLLVFLSNNDFNNLDFVCGGVQYAVLLCRIDLAISGPKIRQKNLLYGLELEDIKQPFLRTLFICK